MSRKQIFSQAFHDTIPVMTGYLFLGAGFGIIMHSKGFEWYWPLFMSAGIYAGAMQYVAVDLLTQGTSLLTVGLTTLMVNARHLFYGISLIDRYKAAGKKKPYLIFGLTDETYSLVSRENIPQGKDAIAYCFWVTLMDHIYWVSGSMLGVFAGHLIHFDLTGVDFALTALFATIVVDQWKSTSVHTAALIGFASAVLSLMIFGSETFLIPAMICIFLLLTLLRSRNGKKEAA